MPQQVVPAYTMDELVGSTASVPIVVIASPLLTGSQWAPPSTLLNTPPPLSEPAYTTCELPRSMASAPMVGSLMPLRAALQWAPPSTDFHTAPSPPA